VGPHLRARAAQAGGFPFFYWYQLILVPVTGFLCWISYLLLRTERAAEAREREHEEARR
jgi:hypothetical protein